MGENWIGFLDGGDTFIEDLPDINFNDQWYYDLGGGYSFTKTPLGSLYYEEWRALVPGLANVRDLLRTINYTVTPTLRVNSALLIGPSSGALWIDRRG